MCAIFSSDPLLLTWPLPEDKALRLNHNKIASFKGIWNTRGNTHIHHVIFLAVMYFSRLSNYIISPSITAKRLSSCQHVQ